MGIFVASLSLAWPSFLSASTDLQQGIGVVTAVQGDVTVDHPDPGGPVAVKLQDDVLFKDVIVTQKESRTKALLDNESLLTVGENSRVEITEHIYDPKDNKRSVIVKLVEGKLRALVGKVFSQAGNRFEIHTSSAVAAARGTYFVVWSEGGRSGVVNIGNSGRVDFSAGGQTVSIAPAQFSMAPQGAAPAPPAPAASPNAPAVVASVVQATVIPDSPKAESPGQLLRTITESRTRAAASTSVDEKTSAASRSQAREDSQSAKERAQETAKQKALQAKAEQELLKQQRAGERQAAREQARQLARLRQEQRQQARQDRQLARARGEAPVRNMERAQRQTQVARLVASGDRQGANEALQFARLGRSLGAGGQQGRAGDAFAPSGGIEQALTQVQTGGDQGGQGQGQASVSVGSGVGQGSGQGQGSQVAQSSAQGIGMPSSGSGTGGGSGSSASSGGGVSSQSGPIKSTFTSSPTAGPRIGVLATVTPPSNISGASDRIIFEDAVARGATSSGSSSSGGSSSGSGSGSSSSSSSSSGSSSSSHTTASSGGSASNQKTEITSSGGTKGNLRENFTRGRRGR